MLSERLKSRRRELGLGIVLPDDCLNLFPGALADAGAVIQNDGNGRRGNAGQFCNGLDGHFGHKIPLFPNIR